MSRVWADKYKMRSELLVMLAIADFSNEDGFAWPSVDTLAQKSICSQRAVQRITAKLIADKKLEVEYGKGPKGTNVYRVVMGGCHHVTPVTTDSAMSPRGVPPLIQPCHPIRQEPSLEPSGTKSTPLAPTPVNSKFEKPAVEAMRLYAAKIGLPESEADRYFDFYESKGWFIGQRLMRDWQAAMRNWRRNWTEGKYENRNRSSAKPNPRLEGVSRNNAVNNYADYAAKRMAKANAELAAKVAANKNSPPPET